MADQEDYPQVTGWSGWIWFAGFMMIISGIVHLIFGLGGIFNYGWYAYTSTGGYVFNLKTWGWSLLIVGILLILSALLLLAGNMLGRIIGVLLALVSLISNVGLIGAAPIWSIIAIVVDILIIYAIAAHGGEMKQHEHQQHQM